MNVRAFVANLGPTMFFAFIGTFASTFAVGGLVWCAYAQRGACKGGAESQGDGEAVHVACAR